MDVDKGAVIAPDADDLSQNGGKKDNLLAGVPPPPGYSDYAENSENYGPVGIKEDG